MPLERQVDGSESTDLADTILMRRLQSAQPCRVLVVDDDSVSRHVLVQALVSADLPHLAGYLKAGRVRPAAGVAGVAATGHHVHEVDPGVGDVDGDLARSRREVLDLADLGLVGPLRRLDHRQCLHSRSCFNVRRTAKVVSDCTMIVE